MAYGCGVVSGSCGGAQVGYYACDDTISSIRRWASVSFNFGGPFWWFCGYALFSLSRSLCGVSRSFDLLI